MVLAIFDTVYLHTVVTFGRKKQATFIIKIQREDRGIGRRWFARNCRWWLAAKVLEGSASARLLKKREITFEGRNKEIISDTLEVGNAPPDLLPSPFAPMGESIAIGVEDIIALFHGSVKVGLFGEIDIWEERDRDCT